MYLRGGGASRLAPTNLVPEVDQLVLATYLVWLPDPVMNWSSAARLRGAILRAYARASDAVEGTKATNVPELRVDLARELVSDDRGA